MKGDRTNRCIIRRLTDAGETAVAILFTTGDVNYRCRTTENQMDGLTFTSRCSRCVRQNPHVIARSKAKQKNPGRRDVHPSPSASLCYVITFVSYLFLSLSCSISNSISPPANPESDCGELRPTYHLPGFCPWVPLGDFRPQTSYFRPQHKNI